MRAVSFKRMQTENGADNTAFYCSLEQRKIQDYYKKNFGKLPDSDLDKYLMDKGYVPKYNRHFFERLENSIQYCPNIVTIEEYRNANLSLQLMKLGVDFTHPYLYYDYCKAKTKYLGYALNKVKTIPMKGLKSPKLSENQLKIINYCLEEYDSIPIMEYDSYEVLSMVMFNEIIPDKDFDKIKDYFISPDLSSALTYADNFWAWKRDKLLENPPLEEDTLKDKKEEKPAKSMFLVLKTPETVDEITSYLSGNYQSNIEVLYIDGYIKPENVASYLAQLGFILAGSDLRTDFEPEEGMLSVFDQEDY
jgi:hypothetical protein